MIRFRRIRTSRDGAEVTATILGPGPDDTFDLWFRATGAPLKAVPEAFATLALPVAMGHGVEVRAPGRLPAGFVRNLDRWQRIFAAWMPDELTPIDVRARRRRERERAPGTAAFFTGGVDSYYTVLENLDRLDALVFVWGFDVPLELLPELRHAVAEGVRSAATELDRPLVEVETNLHEWSDRHGSVWGRTYHAAALSAVAHLLSATYGEVLVASTYAYDDLFAWGSTPITDPLLGGDRLAIVHDGCEADRVERIARIARSETAMRHLRVCWENRDQRYNCGECPKCVRTMVALRICGALDRCETLPDLDIEQVRSLPHTFAAVVARLAELIDHLREAGHDPELLEACEDVLHGLDPAGVRWDLDWSDVMSLVFETEADPSP